MSASYNPQPLPPLDPNLDVTKNHYWSYHSVEALLRCKKPLTASKDEDLFIAVHQICELAFNQMITDMERVKDCGGCDSWFINRCILIVIQLLFCQLMPLSEILPAVNQLSHQDKLRLIHFLLLAVAKEEGFELQPVNHQTQEGLLNQLASTEAVVWLPDDADEAAQTLSDLLAGAKQKAKSVE